MTATTKLDRVMLGKLLRRQHDVVTRDQVIACGMTAAALRHRIRPGGPWQTLLRGVYLAQTGTATADQRDMAALLYAGPGSVITGYAAMRRLGIRAPNTTMVDVLIPAARKRLSSGFARVLRTTRVPETICASGQIRFAMPARAVADAARRLTSLREARAVIADSVQRDWCAITELTRELGDGHRAGSGRLRQVLAEVAAGVRSVTEAEFRDLVRSSGLPMPVFNARLYIADVLLAVADAWWGEARVAAEVDSREWHMSPEEWERTLRRHARMSAQGILVLHFTPKQIRTERAQVVATLRTALEASRGNGLPPVRALPATG